MGEPKLNPETSEYTEYLRLDPTLGYRLSVLPLPNLEGVYRKPRKLTASCLRNRCLAQGLEISDRNQQVLMCLSHVPSIPERPEDEKGF